MQQAPTLGHRSEYRSLQFSFGWAVGDGEGGSSLWATFLHVEFLALFMSHNHRDVSYYVEL